jgi:hypothetical protein
VLGQTLLDVNPAVGTQGETLTLTISGQSTHFQQASYTSVSLRQGTSTVILPEQSTVINDEEIDAVFNFGFIHNLGWYDLKTWNELDGELTLENAFYLYGTPTPPELVSIEPNEGTIGQELEVTISGQYTHFQASTTMVYFKQGTKTIYPNYQETISPTQVDAHFSFNQNDEPGIYDVVTWDPFDGTLVLPESFTLHPGETPAIVNMQPSTAMLGTLNDFSIYFENTHFSSATIVVAYMETPDSEIIEMDFDVVSDELLQCTAILPYHASQGLWNLYVWNNLDGQMQAYDIFYAYSNPDMPHIVSIFPDSCYRGHYTEIEIETENTWFEWSMPQAWINHSGSGDQFSVNIQEIVHNEKIIINFFAPHQNAAGYYDVNISDQIDGLMILEAELLLIDTITGIGDRENEAVLNLFPNPTTGRFKLNSSKQFHNCDVEIYNMVGQKKEFKNLTLNQNQTLNFNIEDFNDGLYFVKIITEEEIFVKKIINQ